MVPFSTLSPSIPYSPTYGLTILMQSTGANRVKWLKSGQFQQTQASPCQKHLKAVGKPGLRWAEIPHFEDSTKHIASSPWSARSPASLCTWVSSSMPQRFLHVTICWMMEWFFIFILGSIWDLAPWHVSSIWLKQTLTKILYRFRWFFRQHNLKWNRWIGGMHW